MKQPHFFALFMLTVTLSAQVNPPTPRGPKHGEERTVFLAAAGKPCGRLAKVDTRWYFYVLPDKTSNGRVSQGFDTRKEAAQWGQLICPKQGVAVVGK